MQPHLRDRGVILLLSPACTRDKIQGITATYGHWSPCIFEPVTYFMAFVPARLGMRHMEQTGFH